MCVFFFAAQTLRRTTEISLYESNDVLILLVIKSVPTLFTNFGFNIITIEISIIMSVTSNIRLYLSAYVLANVHLLFIERFGDVLTSKDKLILDRSPCRRAGQSYRCLVFIA